MQKGPVTPKGFGDILPTEAKKRREFIGSVVPILEEFGFNPLETPTIEFAETLLGKYGEEEKLIYQFEDKGGRKLALRYDLTVPFARFVSNNLGLLNPTFARYQIGQVFRGENPQKGRRREFTQFDFDIVGSENIEDDAKVITAAIFSARKIGLKNFQMKINDRRFILETTKLSDIQESTIPGVLREIDKIGKKPQMEIDRTIQGYGNSYVSTATISGTISNFNQYSDPQTFDILKNTFEDTPGFNEINLQNELKMATEKIDRKQIFDEPQSYKNLKEILFNNGVRENEIAFERRLIRGLDYYTGFIYELKLSDKFEGMSIGGGGRYDNLIGMFAGRKIPAVGFSFGIDRIVELLD